MPRRFTIALTLVLFACAATARADRQDEQTLQDLRAKRQYEAAEKYCADQLADAKISAERRADLTIELSRTLADHAAQSAPADADRLWKKARAVIDEFTLSVPRDSKVLVVRVQGTLVTLAQAEAAREGAEMAAGRQRDTDGAKDLLQNVISDLRKLDGTITALVRSANSKASDGRLTPAQLSSLLAHVHYQQARALRNQGLCFPASSPDRVNALQQAIELLAAPPLGDSDTPLGWSARVDEITCLRLLEDYRAAEKNLGQLERAAPKQFAGKLRAERIRLALARGQLDDALAEAGLPGRPGETPEAALAQLEAYVRALQRAQSQRDAKEAAEWERTAESQVRAIEQSAPETWTRKAEAILARAIGSLAESQNASTLVRAAQSFYRGEQFAEALAAYDRAIEQARQTGQDDLAFDAGYSAATIEKERKRFRGAIDRYRKLAVGAPQNPRAPAAHLLAVHCAAQLAASQQPPNLDEYEGLLREHVATWPKADTASQAWWWLGRLLEHEASWQEAVRALRNVESGHPQYVPAIEASGRCAAAMLAQMRESGNPNKQLTRDTIRYFEQFVGPRESRDGPWTPAARAAVLAAAPLWIKEVPGGGIQAEALIKDGLATAGDAPPEWRTELRRLMVIAVAAQGRIDEAEKLLDQVPIGTAADSLAMIGMLKDLVEQATFERKQRLASLALLEIDDLMARRDELDAATRLKITRLKAATLVAAGRRRDAIDLLETAGKENPRDGQLQEELAALLSAAADVASRKNAVSKWREVATKSRPGTARWFRANYELARTQLALGSPEAARATIKAVEAKQPEMGGVEMKARFVQLQAECDLPPAPLRGKRK